MSNIYDELNVKKYINAAGTYTAVGASKMSEFTLSKMKEASQSFVEIKELLKAVNGKIAEMTDNEAAFVCNSCSTAIFLAISAFVELSIGKPIATLSREEIESKEVIMLTSHHIPYDRAITQTGVKLKFIGYANPNAKLSEDVLRNAITDKTVGLYYYSHTPMGYAGDGILGASDFIRIGHEFGIPVLLDAASQLPPKSNFRNFTKMGADVVVFSGGKDLKGPQASGLILGKKLYLDKISELGFPNYGIGRLMKIGREEIVAVYCAVKEYLQNDEDKRLARCEEQVQQLIELLSKSSLFFASRTWPNEAGQPIPRCFVEIKNNTLITSSRLVDRLKDCNPGIYCYSGNQNGVFINPMCLEDGDIDYIAKELLRIEKELN